MAATFLVASWVAGQARASDYCLVELIHISLEAVAFADHILEEPIHISLEAAAFADHILEAAAAASTDHILTELILAEVIRSSLEVASFLLEFIYLINHLNKILI